MPYPNANEIQQAVAYCSRSRNIEKSSREFLSSLKGIIFLGTPHIGSRAVSYRSFLEKLAPSPSRPILDSLTQSLESTINDADEFRNFAEDQKLPVSIFYESQPSITPGGPIRVRYLPYSFIITSKMLTKLDRHPGKRF